VAALALTMTHAITEDDSTMQMRDASMTKERPRLDGYDMDEDTMRQMDE
jgi:heat shock protein 90kDa beta